LRAPTHLDDGIFPSLARRLRLAHSLDQSRVSYEATRRLVLTECVWKETLRFMPITTGVPRVALRDTELGGWPIRAGTFVNAMMATALRACGAWTNPERFDPERFSEERAEDRTQRGLFLPFGSGAHACIGMHLATVETKAFWHAMLTRCRFRLARDYDARHTYTPLGVVSGKVALVIERAG
jgi:cytochrome P450